MAGSLKYFIPNIDIWALFDPPKRENSPLAVSNQKNLTETKSAFVEWSGWMDSIHWIPLRLL